MKYIKSIRNIFFALSSASLIYACDGSTTDASLLSDVANDVRITTIPAISSKPIFRNLERVSVFFDKKIDVNSISREQITISPTTNFTLDKTQLESTNVLFLSFSADLEPNKTYAFSINNFKLAGSTENQSFSWSYSTENQNDLSAPVLVSTFPDANTVAVNDQLTQLSFDFDKAITFSNLNNLTISPAIQGSVTIVDNSLIFTPSTALLANNAYTVSLRGISDSFGNVSNDVSFSFTTGNDSKAPTDPAPLNRVRLTDNLVEISWVASTDVNGISNYQVLRGGIAQSMSLMSTTTSTSFTDTNLNPDTPYIYQIIATDSNGNTAASNLLNVVTLSAADTTPPSNPANLMTSASPTFSNIQISWGASTDNESFSGYRISRRINNGSWSTLASNQQATSFDDNSVTANTSYEYQVIAFDTAGNSAASNVLSVATPIEPDTTSPVFSSANLRTSVTTTSTSVNLQWNLATDNTAVTGYRVLRSINGASAVEIANINNLTFSDNSVSASNSYGYQVFAYDSSANETSSNLLNVTTPALMTAASDSFSTPYQTGLNNNLAVNDSLSPNSPTTWSLVSQASSGTANINSNGSFSYSPADGFSGSVSFTYRMQDALNNFSNTATVTVNVQPLQSASACDTLYANAGGFSPVTSKSIASVPNITKPVKGNHYLDPNFGTCIVRVTNHANDSNTIANRVVPDYSRRQVFNADQSRMLLLASDGYWHLYDANNYSHIRRVSLQGDSVEFQWHPTNPDLLYRMAYNGGLRIYLQDLTDATDNTSTVVADFTNVSSISGYPGFTSINQVWPNATRFMTGEEGSPSADGRYWALMGMSGDFNNNYGIIVYDMQTNSIIGVYDYATDGGGIGGPNNITMSPSGTHVVALWNPPACDGQNGRPAGRGTLNNPCGTMSFSPDFSRAQGLAMNGEHGDTAIGINGNDVYVGIEYQSRGAIEVIDLETGNLVSNIETNVWIGGAVHISGRAHNRPGWVVISHYSNSPVNAWYSEEIFMAKLDANPVIIRLAKHQSNSADYWSQPHATISRDATKVVWGSNWSGTLLDLDTYMINVPSSKLDSL